MRKSLVFLFVFLVLLLLVSGIAAAGFWQDITGMFSLSLTKIFKKQTAVTAAKQPAAVSISSLGLMPLENLPFEGLVCYNAGCLDANKRFNFLIVTRHMFVGNLSTFVAWKKNKGLNVSIVTVDFINVTYSGENLGIKVRNALHSMKSANGVKFVLLIGDTEVGIVGGPTEEESAEEYEARDHIGPFTQEAILNSYTLERLWNVPTMYYHRLGSENYATDTDNVMPSDLPYTTNYSWLEPPIADRATLETNFVADIYIGRWSVRTNEELQNVVYKTINMHPIQKVMMIKDQSFSSPIRESCHWPPDETEEIRCYVDMENEVMPRVLNGTIVTELISVNISNQTDAFNAKEKIISMPNDTLLVETFHGGLTGIDIGEASIYIDDLEDFQYAFPLFHGRSCHISAYYLYEESVFSEALIKSVRGPAVYVDAPNNYFFYLNLLAGKTLGESYYSGTDIFAAGGGTQILMGDPSLVLYEPPPQLRKPPISQFRKPLMTLRRFFG
mgnify:CR=1 FL=1